MDNDKFNMDHGTNENPDQNLNRELASENENKYADQSGDRTENINGYDPATSGANAGAEANYNASSASQTNANQSNGFNPQGRGSNFNGSANRVVFGSPQSSFGTQSDKMNTGYGTGYNAGYNSNGNQYNSGNYNNGFGGNYYGGGYNAYNNRAEKPKKEKRGASKGFVALMVCVGIVLSGVVGYVSSSFAASHITCNNQGTGGSISVNYVDPIRSDAKEETDAAHVNNIAGQSVVEISTEKVSTSVFYGQYVTQGAGSGVIISSENGKSYILTCAHVVSEASKLLVTLNNTNKDQFEATVVGSDSITDIAVISINTDGLKTATIGDYDSLVVGDYVVAIGNPLGSLGGSVTDGIISALDRSIIIDGQSYTLIQTNASINPGNSGGGLFDKDGNLIGVVNAKSSGESSGTQIEGIGFAIPIKKAMEVADELLQNGYVTGRVQLGLSLFEITSQNDYYSYWNYQRYITGYGVYVAESQNDSFQVGDRLAAIDGIEISSVSEIKNLLLEYSVGDVVKVSVYRLDASGKSRLVEVEIVLTEKTA